MARRPSLFTNSGKTFYEFGSPERVDGCTLNGIEMPRSDVLRKANFGMAAVVPGGSATRWEAGRFEFFRAYADGYSGFMPAGATYQGGGYFGFGGGSSGMPTLGTFDPSRPRVPISGSDGEGGRLSLTPDVMFVGAGFGQPQNPAPETPFRDQYTRCAGGGAPPRSALGTLGAASRLEGVSPTLLAVTWAGESGFSLDPRNNPNDGRPGNADIGPAQINYRTWNGTPQVEGLEGVFGTALGGNEVFNGNALSNLRAAARILNSYGSGREAAGYYRTGIGSFSKTKVGKSEFNKRAGLYDKLAPSYDAFFNCMGGGR